MTSHLNFRKPFGDVLPDSALWLLRAFPDISCATVLYSFGDAVIKLFRHVPSKTKVGNGGPCVE